MEKNIEIEYKVLINEEQAKALLQMFPFDLPQIQKNTYYDTSNALLQTRGWVARIRGKSEKLVFTLKIPSDEGLVEFECLVSDDSLTQPDILNLLLEHDVKEHLLPMGHIITNRYSYFDELGVWCIDYTDFGSFSDIEIEFELYQENLAALPYFLSILKKIGVYYVAAPSKFNRFLQKNL